MDDNRAALFKALCAFQKTMQNVAKTERAQVQSAKGSFSYTYADIAGVIEAIREPLAAHGLCHLQLVTNIDGQPALTTILGHESGASVEATVPLRGDNLNDPQKFGGIVTYYRRYALLGILGLATEDDDGQLASQPRQQQQQPRQAPPPRQQSGSAPDDGGDMDLGDEIIAEFFTRIEQARSTVQLEDIGKQLRSAGINDGGLRAAYKTKQIQLAAMP